MIIITMKLIKTLQRRATYQMLFPNMVAVILEGVHCSYRLNVSQHVHYLVQR